MPKPRLGPGSAYDLPPASLKAVSPDLYNYLLMFHVRVFGSPGGTGDLDADNVASAATVNHSTAQNLAADDHTQYLTTGRHGAISGNPHSVTAAQVGKDTAQWNADRLQGKTISTTAPGSRHVLKYDGTDWIPQDTVQLVPTMTTVARDALTATNGMIIYNSTTNAFNFYENGAWVTK